MEKQYSLMDAILEGSSTTMKLEEPPPQTYTPWSQPPPSAGNNANLDWILNLRHPTTEEYNKMVQQEKDGGGYEHVPKPKGVMPSGFNVPLQRKWFGAYFLDKACVEAVKQYNAAQNEEGGPELIFDDILKVMKGGFLFYITFTARARARDSEDVPPKTLQTRVYVKPALNGTFEIHAVRLKPDQ